MSKYKVTVWQHTRWEVIVEADSEEEAMENFWQVDQDEWTDVEDDMDATNCEEWD